MASRARGDREGGASKDGEGADKLSVQAFDKASSERDGQFDQREAELKAIKASLDAEREELDERALYVASVEDSLVDRLNESSLRAK